MTSAVSRRRQAPGRNSRGRILRVAIERLIGKRLAADFYRQPRILALCSSDREVRQTWVLRWVRSLLFDKAELEELRNPPAYLEPATFAATVLEQLVPVDGRDPVRRLVQLGGRAETGGPPAADAAQPTLALAVAGVVPVAASRAAEGDPQPAPRRPRHEWLVPRPASSSEP